MALNVPVRLFFRHFFVCLSVSSAVFPSVPLLSFRPAVPSAPLFFRLSVFCPSVSSSVFPSVPLSFRQSLVCPSVSPSSVLPSVPLLSYPSVGPSSALPFCRSLFCPTLLSVPLLSCPVLSSVPLSFRLSISPSSVHLSFPEPLPSSLRHSFFRPSVCTFSIWASVPLSLRLSVSLSSVRRSRQPLCSSVCPSVSPSVLPSVPLLSFRRFLLSFRPYLFCSSVSDPSSVLPSTPLCLLSFRPSLSEMTSEVN